MGRPAEAIPELRAAIATWTGAHGPEYSRVVTTRMTLAESLYDAGQLDTAAAEADEALVAARKIFPDDHRQRVIATRLAGRIERDRRRYEDADALFEESLAAAAMGSAVLAERTSTEIEYAKSLAAQGRRNAARSRLETYLAELDPADAETAGQRDRIESALGAL
jgi:predicted nucleic acid-binding protein